MHVTRECLPRALRIVDALLKAIEARGWALELSDTGRPATWIVVGEERIKLRVVEQVNRQEAERAPTARDSDLAWHRERWIYTPTGIVSIVIGTTYGFGRRTWKDTADRPLEQQLNAVLVGIIKTAETYRQETAAREERAAQWREEQRRREELRRQREIVEARRLAIIGQAEAWRQSQNLTAFLAGCEQRFTQRCGQIKPESTEGRWLSWARAYVKQLDPLENGMVSQMMSEFDRHGADDPHRVKDEG
jgi:hypothetical protein